MRLSKIFFAFFFSVIFLLGLISYVNADDCCGGGYTCNGQCAVAPKDTVSRCWASAWVGGTCIPSSPGREAPPIQLPPTQPGATPLPPGATPPPGGTPTPAPVLPPGCVSPYSACSLQNNCATVTKIDPVTLSAVTGPGKCCQQSCPAEDWCQLEQWSCSGPDECLSAGGTWVYNCKGTYANGNPCDLTVSGNKTSEIDNSCNNVCPGGGKITGSWCEFPDDTSAPVCSGINACTEYTSVAVPNSEFDNGLNDWSVDQGVGVRVLGTVYPYQNVLTSDGERENLLIVSQTINNVANNTDFAISVTGSGRVYDPDGPVNNPNPSTDGTCPEWKADAYAQACSPNNNCSSEFPISWAGQGWKTKQFVFQTQSANLKIKLISRKSGGDEACAGKVGAFFDSVALTDLGTCGDCPPVDQQGALVFNVWDSSDITTTNLYTNNTCATNVHSAPYRKVIPYTFNQAQPDVYAQFTDSAGNTNTNPCYACGVRCETPVPSGKIEGTLFYDADGDGCFDGGEEGQFVGRKPAGFDVIADGAVNDYDCAVGPENRLPPHQYSCTVPVDVANSYTLKPENHNPPFLATACAKNQYGGVCNSGCSTFVSAANGTYNVDIGFRDWYGPWFQTRGGDVYAGGRITSSIPSTCIGSCQPYFSLQESGVIQSGNSINSGSGSLGENHSWPVNNETLSNIKKWDYEYFLKNTYDRHPLIDFDPNGLFHNPLNPTQDLESHIWELSGDMTINNPQALDSSQKIVILVSGSLNINNNIAVPSGSFLMFIVRGNINISPDVTVLQGIYLSDGQINTGTVNTQLIVSGALIADADRTNDKLSLQRDFQGNQNNTLPAEKILFRPDFILNAPDELKKSLMVSWLETAP